MGEAESQLMQQSLVHSSEEGLSRLFQRHRRAQRKVVDTKNTSAEASRVSVYMNSIPSYFTSPILVSGRRMRPSSVKAMM